MLNFLGGPIGSCVNENETELVKNSIIQTLNKMVCGSHDMVNSYVYQKIGVNSLDGFSENRLKVFAEDDDRRRMHAPQH